MFYDKKEIHAKATKLYESSKVFLSYMEDEEMFPLLFKLKTLKQNDIMKNYQIVLDEVEYFKKSNLNIVYDEFHFKTIGSQKLPVEVVFETRNEFLSFIAKKSEFHQFIENYEKIVARYEVLKTLLRQKPKIIAQNFQNWERLLDVCDFFAVHSKPNVYVRELAIKNVDTKFIERNRATLDLLLSNILKCDEFDNSIINLGNYGFERKYGLKYPLPQVRFRILDDALKIRGLSDVTLNVDEFANLSIACENVYIVENQITTLSFPNMKNSIVIFGSGYGVGTLKNVQWLHEKNIYYWGDIDKDGFAILSQARGYFKNIKSIFMNEEVIDLFKEFGVQDDKNENVFKELKNLTADEQKVYDNLQNNFYGNNFRLEQERLPFDYICKISF